MIGYHLQFWPNGEAWRALTLDQLAAGGGVQDEIYDRIARRRHSIPSPPAGRPPLAAFRPPDRPDLATSTYYLSDRT